MCSGIAVAPTKEPFEYCQVNETSEDRKERISGLILQVWKCWIISKRIKQL